MDTVEARRCVELRIAIAAMQAELPPQVRVSGAELRTWQREAEEIYRVCYRAASRQHRSPYSDQATYKREKRRREKLAEVVEHEW